MHILQTEIKYIPGVGPKKAEILQKELDVFTLGDLLRWYPYRYKIGRASCRERV